MLLIWIVMEALLVNEIRGLQVFILMVVSVEVILALRDPRQDSPRGRIRGTHDMQRKATT